MACWAVAGRWGKMKSAAMPTLPALKQPGGKIMCETEDIMKHFATLGGKLLVSQPLVLHRTHHIAKVERGKACGQPNVKCCRRYDSARRTRTRGKGAPSWLVLDRTRHESQAGLCWTAPATGGIRLLRRDIE
eukprot:4618641-Prymnesium_polylepis.1